MVERWKRESVLGWLREEATPSVRLGRRFAEDAELGLGVPRGGRSQSCVWRGAGGWALSQAHRASDYWAAPEPGSRGLDEGTIWSPPGDGRPCLSPAANRCAPRCGRGRPRSQGGRCQSQTWRCARPRARSPPGDREPCLSPASAQRFPRCGRGRPRSQGASRQSQIWRDARPRAWSPQGDGSPCLSPATAQPNPCGRGRALPGGGTGADAPSEDAELGLGVPRGGRSLPARFLSSIIPLFRPSFPPTRRRRFGWLRVPPSGRRGR
jgi:hypothetical protein